MPVKKRHHKKATKTIAKPMKRPPLHKRVIHKIKTPIKNAYAHARQTRAESIHKTGKLSRRSELPYLEKLPAWWKLLWRATIVVVSNWRQFVPVILIFATLMWLISGVYTIGAISGLKELFITPETVFESFDQTFLTISSLADNFFGSTASSGDTGPDILKALLFGVFWLVILWLTRYYFAKKRSTVREALYKSGSALVPILLMLLIFLIELIPLALALLLANSIFGDGFLEGVAEKSIFGVFALLLAVLSLYLLAGSLVALPIVSLPGMYPWQALVNAKRLVTGRRARIIMKMAGLVFGTIAMWAILFVPFVLLDNFVLCKDDASCWSTITLVPFAFYALTTLALCVFIIGFYLLYRSLLEKSETAT